MTARSWHHVEILHNLASSQIVKSLSLKRAAGVALSLKHNMHKVPPP